MVSAVVFGSTGAVGRNVRASLLKSSEITQVTEIGRSLLDKPESGSEKLTQVKLDEKAEIKPNFDLVFITLGTTRKDAGSAENFEKIDRHLVVDLAKKVAREDAHVIYCSSTGANANSNFLYTRSKGLTEIDLSKLGYKSTTVMRPGILAGADRKESRPSEMILAYLTGFLGKFTNSLQIPVTKLGESMVIAGLKQFKGESIGEQANNISFISNKLALELS